MRSLFRMMSTMAIVGVGLGGAGGAALMACGSSPQNPLTTTTSGGGGAGGAAPQSTSSGSGATTASTGTTVTAGAGGAGGADAAPPPDDAAPVYPAFQPKVQQVLSNGGPVLAAPQIVPIVFPASSFETETADFVSKAVTSTEWMAQLAEYGVGAGTSVDPIAAAALPGKNITKADLEAYIVQQIGSGAWGTPDTTEFGSQYYVLFLPKVVSIALPIGKNTCNGGPVGYHNEVVVGATHVPYAVVANCNDVIDQVTRTAWHEIVEGCADPFAAPNRAYFKVGAAWSHAFVGGEIGDMCEHRTDAKSTPTDIGYAIQTMWSNAAALAYHDPCIPAASMPYFAAAPVLPDMVTLLQASVPGVKIPVGSSQTIEVQLFSDGPTPGPWDVSAKESLGGTTLAFQWDKTSGQNGEVLHLTITAMAEAMGGTTFEIASSLGAASSQWVGAVEN